MHLFVSADLINRNISYAWICEKPGNKKWLQMQCRLVFFHSTLNLIRVGTKCYFFLHHLTKTIEDIVTP